MKFSKENYESVGFFILLDRHFQHPLGHLQLKF